MKTNLNQGLLIIEELKIFLKVILKKFANLQIPKEFKKIDKIDLLVSSDYNSFYSSSMTHKVSKWPKKETAKAIKKEVTDRLCEIFTSGEWKTSNKSRSFKKIIQPKRYHLSTFQRKRNSL